MAVISKTEQVYSPIFFPLKSSCDKWRQNYCCIFADFLSSVEYFSFARKNSGNLLADFCNEANKYKRQFRSTVLFGDSGTLSTGRNYEWRSRTTSKTMDLFLRKITWTLEHEGKWRRWFFYGQKLRWEGQKLRSLNALFRVKEQKLKFAFFRQEGPF